MPFARIQSEKRYKVTGNYGVLLFTKQQLNNL